MRPEPAPITWMIAAHSAFFSMSATDAFWTLRILPRIGSSAWNSDDPRQLGGAQRGVALDDEQLAALDVVAAAVGQLGRQRGGLQRVLAPLRLLVLARGDPRFISATTFSRTARGLRLVVPLGGLVSGLELAARRPGPRCARTAEVPRTSLVWPSNCGSASRTVTTAVRPSRTSSFSTLSLADLEQSGVALDLLAERLDQRPLEAGTWVPPLGVAMMLTNERTSVS